MNNWRHDARCLSACECHDPVCLPRLASVFGERLLPSSDVDRGPRPQKAAQYIFAPHTLLSEELTDATEEAPRHRRQQRSRLGRVGPVDPPLPGRGIEKTQSDSFEWCAVTNCAVAI